MLLNDLFGGSFIVMSGFTYLVKLFAPVCRTESMTGLDIIMQRSRCTTKSAEQCMFKSLQSIDAINLFE